MSKKTKKNLYFFDFRTKYSTAEPAMGTADTAAGTANTETATADTAAGTTDTGKSGTTF